ncbi:MAG: hypothetical protein OXS29_16265, partial [bacterium]|nr:hypothetical protein [bacterium]MDE0438130.1 hypothetical protein [bacterium]
MLLLFVAGSRPADAQGSDGGSPPDTPTNQSYEHTTDGTITLTWDAPPTATHYTIYYDDYFSTGCYLGSHGPSLCETLATNLTTTTYTHTTPDRVNNYYWIVACNNYGCLLAISEIHSYWNCPVWWGVAA